MKITHADDVPQVIVREPGAKNVTLRRLIDTPDGADRFLMSMFEMEPNGATPPHYHDWEHELYVLSGSLRLTQPVEGVEHPLRQGDVVFIPRGEPHGMVTGPEERCRLLLIAPAERPPVNNVFLSEEPYEYDGAAAGAER
jgi:quercetin dioxygenase-like cupin family protein